MCGSNCWTCPRSNATPRATNSAAAASSGLLRRMKALGRRARRHSWRAKLLVYVVDMAEEGADQLEVLQALKRETEAFDVWNTRKPWIVVRGRSFPQNGNAFAGSASPQGTAVMRVDTTHEPHVRVGIY